MKQIAGRARIWLQGLLRAEGLDAQVLPSKHNPVVIAASPPRHDSTDPADYDATMMLFPPGTPQDGSSPPFEAELSNGDIIGQRRGQTPKGT